MSTTAKHLAARLGADERTLRRAIEQGTVRGTRVSQRRLAVSEAEERYLRSHWDLLRRLRGALRTERNVRLAAVFGSLARGDGHPGSDLDLLVELEDDSWERRHRLTTRLERLVGRPVELIVIARAVRDNPGLLADALTDGRVIVDREDRWPGLMRRLPSLRSASRAREARDAVEARALVEDLIRA
jgi:predicted nucleotidyltransferase